MSLPASAMANPAGAPDPTEWRRREPYRPHGPSAAWPKHRGRCHCGDVSIHVLGEPSAVVVDHGKQCQELLGAPYEWSATYAKHEVNFVNGARFLAWYGLEDKQSGHQIPCLVRCARCGAPIMIEEADRVRLFPATLNIAEAATKFAPNYHVNYGERVTDVADETPKWAGEKWESELVSPPKKEKTA